MSCFIAIPSTGDTDAGRFKRLGEWDLEKEIIQIKHDGAAARLSPAACDHEGLLVVGRAFLNQPDTTAAKFLLSGRNVKLWIDGIFLHPGITNAPGKKEVMNVLGKLPNGLSALSEKAVAFTHSGSARYQVHCLHDLWEWLASPAIKGEEDKVPDFNIKIQSLKHDFAKLFRLSGRSQLVELFVLAEGCVERQLVDSTRSEFKKNLVLELKGKASWLQNDEDFKDSVLAILRSDGDRNLEEATRSFIAAIRKFFEAKASK